MIEIAKNPCTSKSSMYQQQFKQLSFTDFILPFAGRLDPENRWVKLSNTIPWFAAEQIYAKYFTAPNGNPALSVRVALGSLIIKETLRLSDEETVATVYEIAKTEGLFICPEGAAAFAALRHLLSEGLIGETDVVLVFNTAAGIKYPEIIKRSGH